MNLTFKTTGTGVRKEFLDMEKGLELLSCIHPQYQGEVVFHSHVDEFPLEVCILIPSINLDWMIGTSCVYVHRDLLTTIEFEQAKTRIRELTSPKVDQPAPKARTAADAQPRDIIWATRGSIGAHEYSVKEVHADFITVNGWDASLYFEDFGTEWGFIEEQQP